MEIMMSAASFGSFSTYCVSCLGGEGQNGGGGKWVEEVRTAGVGGTKT